MKRLFLHGLDSSSLGTKGRFFRKKYPNILTPDFEGPLDNRLQSLEKICASFNELILIGSSFGGLMATCFAINHPQRVKRLVLLAPALNFPDFTLPQTPLSVPAIVIIGALDTVTPPHLVLPLAQETFTNLTIQKVDDDHMLHETYAQLNWNSLLFPDKNSY